MCARAKSAAVVYSSIGMRTLTAGLATLRRHPDALHLGRSEMPVPALAPVAKPSSPALHAPLAAALPSQDVCCCLYRHGSEYDG